MRSFLLLVVGSPQILELSGIGRGDVLQQAGIPIKLERRQLGENLQDHLQLRCAYKVTGIPTLNEKASKACRQGAMTLEYLLRRSGPMSMAPSQLGLHPLRPVLRDRQSAQSRAAAQSGKFGEAVHPFLPSRRVCNLRPDSRSRLDPHQVTGSSFTTGNQAELSHHRKRPPRCRRRNPHHAPYRGTGSIAEVPPEEFKPGPAYETQEQLEGGAISAPRFSIRVGTCRMGQDAEAIADPRLRFNGIAGLRVADASVMPTITSPATPTRHSAIAEKAAQMTLPPITARTRFPSARSAEMATGSPSRERNFGIMASANWK